jgi:hypothetical protein
VPTKKYQKNQLDMASDQLTIAGMRSKRLLKHNNMPLSQNG